ncbi:MAG: hypothetical protein LBC02_10470 [Planctomycetaceae bacterium]|nr:hypothetical protein [Planctomycetaceae bacterium]
MLQGSELLPASEFRILRSRLHGHVDAVLHVFRQLGLDTLISRNYAVNAILFLP